MQQPFSSFVEVLRRRAEAVPEQIAFGSLNEKLDVSQTLTYAGLDRRARAIAAGLQDLPPGERCLLAYPAGIEFVGAFFGCLYAGVVPVPVLPFHLDRRLARLSAVASDAGATAALTTAGTKRQIDACRGVDLPPMRWSITDEEVDYEADARLAGGWRDRSVRGEDVALLQYTSGSTGTPRGVVVSHANLLANAALIQRSFQAGPETIGLSWLPAYHDMGLIGGVLQPVYAGCTVLLMSPTAFLKTPLNWLRAVSRHRVSISGAPDFAYKLCSREAAALGEDVDLGSWRVAFTGAEPVRAQTLDAFSRAFAGNGFRRSAFLPCYGMAEATLWICGHRGTAEAAVGTFRRTALEAHRAETEDPRGAGAVALVGCGRTAEGQSIRIVDPQSSRPCPDSQVGEIWVSGPNVAAGYWRRAEESEQTFGARLANGEGPFLRTGDLGFLHAGELFVTGRLKDLIILRGRNHYPQDIERVVEESHPGLRAGGCAAFSVEESGEEVLVVLQEVRRNALQEFPAGEVIAAIRQRVSEHEQVQAHRVVLLEAGQVPRTSSGKVRRHESRARYLRGDLEVAAESSLAPRSGRDPASVGHSPGPGVAGRLREIVARELGVEPDRLSGQAPLTSWGLDSLLATRIAAGIQDGLGVGVGIEALFACGSLEELAGLVETLAAGAPDGACRPPALAAAPADRHEPFPLTDVQQAYWVGRNAAYELGGVASHVYFELESAGYDPERLSAAWRRLVDRHEMLRAVVLPEGEQRILETVPPFSIPVLDLSGLGAPAAGERLAEVREEMSHQLLPLGSWPMFDIRLTRLRADRWRLHFSLDLLIADLSSLLRLFSEWSVLYEGPEHALEPPGCSFRDCVLLERELRGTDLHERSRRYWLDRVETLPPPPQLPLAGDPASLRHPRFTRRTGRLDAGRWRALRERAAAAGVTPSGLLCAAFAEVLTRWSKGPRFLLTLTVYGRPPVHPRIHEVVGDFTSIELLEVDNGERAPFVERARRHQRQLARDLDHRHLSGVEVLREAARRGAGRPRAGSPVVFTSALGLGPHSAAALGEPVYGISQTPQVLLDHQVYEQNGELAWNWDAVEALFPAGLLEDMFAAYGGLIGRLASGDAAWGETVPVPAPMEHLARRAEVNATARPLSERLLHSCFLEQAERDPGAPAVLDARRTLTYGELAGLAGSLGRELRRAGAGRGDLVAVVLEKGWEQVVAVLGVLAAGAAYVPVDPRLPDSRRLQLLAHAGVRWAVTVGPLDRRLTWPEGLDRLLVDEPWPDSGDLPVPAAPGAPEDLAYVIYTSGSTGVPKGVMIDHRAAVNTIEDVNRRFQLGPADRVLALSSLSFDLSVYDLFGTLAAGGAIVMPRPGSERDPEHWARSMAERGVTVWSSVPALMQMLVEYLEGRAGDPAPLRLVLLSGDWIPLDLPGRVRERWNGAAVVGLGGATEAAIWSNLFVIEGRNPSWKSVPYGRPLANQSFQVLDGQMEPCPVWVPGQLYIGGHGLARGYWRDEETTRAAFPLHPRTGERLYRTGDLGRYLPDGDLEFLGREDFQVKVRGFRIELGDVEAALGGHPRVSQAAAVRRGGSMDGRIVAYVVPAAGTRLEPGELESFARERLPEYMVPSAWMVLDRLPLTANGKVDRSALPPLEDAAMPRAARPARPANEAERTIAAIVREVLGVSDVDPDRNLFDLGANSVQLVQVHRKVEEALGGAMPLVDLFRHPTVARLAARLAGGTAPPATAPAVIPPPRTSGTERDIAILGMSGRFPGSRSLGEFWRNLAEGREGLRRLDDEEIERAGVPRSLHELDGYVKLAATLDDVEAFDADFFGFTPREATLLDPQHRIFLECAWEALEDAGYRPSSPGPRVGVFAGASLSTYLLLHLLSDLSSRQPTRFLENLIANDKDYLATRVSYKLDLQGPSLAVQTACSTSLVAVALAMDSLLKDECDLALAGGVTVRLPQEMGYLHQDGSFLSPDGRCRSFDAGARGTVFGNGAGVVVLKRLDRALADGDCIDAVLKGAAVNNDGALKVGYTAPSAPGQAEVIERSQRLAGVHPDTISYIEAHGTGTALGDPVEVSALTQVFRAATDRRQFCALGSVKSNVGHLDAAAGVAGLIKTALALRYEIIPPSLHFETPNPQIDFAGSPFFVNTEALPWPRTPDRPRRAGVSSFGIGGTNCHVVLEEAPLPVREAVERERPLHIVPLSARGPEALRELARRHLAPGVVQPGPVWLADAAHTAGTGRAHGEHRLAVVAATGEELAAKLETYLAGHRPPGLLAGEAPRGTRPKVAFLFGGQGVLRAGAGRQLYDTQPLFRRALERCADLLRPWRDRPLLEVLYSGDGGELARASYGQPALFALEYALAELWRSWGVLPDAVLGHSLGEYVAACVAGALTLEEALALVAERGRLTEALPERGHMTAVHESEERVAWEIEDDRSDVAIAAVNGPRHCVLSGRSEVLTAVEARLAGHGIKTERLQASHAFHSPLVEPMLDGLHRAAAGLAAREPGVPMVSSLDAAWAGAGTLDAGHWCRHACGTVRFREGMERLAEHGCTAFVGIAPDADLLARARGCVPGGDSLFLPSLRRGRGDWESMLASLGALYVRGAAVDWAGFDQGYGRRRIHLPTYPWQRKRYWQEAPLPAERRVEPTPAFHPLLGPRLRAVALDERQVLHESRLGPEDPGFLGRHRIHGQVVLPGTAFLEMALAAGVRLLRSDVLVLEDVAIQQALLLPGATTVQTWLTREEDGRLTFRIFSLADEGEEPAVWTLHASGSVRRGDGGRPLPEPAGALTAGEEVRAERFYAELRARGVDLGPPFRSIRQLWRSPAAGQALGRVALDQEEAEAAGSFVAHPALLDGCCQVIGAAVDRPTDEAYLPVGIERLRVHGRLGRSVWSRATLRDTGTGEEILRADVRVLDPEGGVLAEAEGLTFRRAPRRALLRADEGSRVGLYTREWRRREREPRTTIQEPQRPWLVLADSGGVGDQLLAELDRRGWPWIRVDRSDRWDQVLREAPEAGNVVYLWGLDAKQDPEEAQRLGCGGALSLVQALGRAGPNAPPRLWFVTRGAQAVGDERPVDAFQGLLWGLARTLALERPEWRCACLDLGPELRVDELVDEMAVPDGENQIVLRDGVRYVARLARRSRPADPVSPVVRGDRCYLITGAAGGLGLAVVRWLAEQGARYLLCLGRREPSTEILALLGRLEARGVSALFVTCDVADTAALEQALDTARQRMPPLGGVMHLAGTLDDGLLADQDWPRIARVLSPKVAGAWNLHRLVREDLDFFVCFSSFAALLGSPAQGGYAAANAFLDALAQARRAQGLRGLSIAWGPWEGAGMAAALREPLRRRLLAHGVRAATPEEYLALLGELLPGEAAQVAAGAVDWEDLLRAWPGDAPRLLDELTSGRPAAPRPDILDRLAAAPEGRRHELLTQFLQEQLAHTLGLGSPAAVAPRARLFDLGLDSLMAVELKAGLERGLERTLPSTLLFDYPTVEALTGFLLGGVEPPPELPVEPADAGLAAELSKIASLSEEEALRQLLGSPREAAGG